MTSPIYINVDTLVVAPFLFFPFFSQLFLVWVTVLVYAYFLSLNIDSWCWLEGFKKDFQIDMGFWTHISTTFEYKFSVTHIHYLHINLHLD